MVKVKAFIVFVDLTFFNLLIKNGSSSAVVNMRNKSNKDARSFLEMLFLLDMC